MYNKKGKVEEKVNCYSRLLDKKRNGEVEENERHCDLNRKREREEARRNKEREL